MEQGIQLRTADHVFPCRNDWLSPLYLALHDRKYRRPEPAISVGTVSDCSFNQSFSNARTNISADGRLEIIPKLSPSASGFRPLVIGRQSEHTRGRHRPWEPQTQV
jgi:hypothetical protein